VREIALGLVCEDLASIFRHKERMTYEPFLHIIDGRKQGALRVSVGLATNFSDVYRFLQFAQTMIDRSAPPSPARQSKHSSGNVTGFCVCSYRDNRREKRFCPQCGRPFPAVRLVS
jgi:hypothetical protein